MRKILLPVLIALAALAVAWSFLRNDSPGTDAVVEREQPPLVLAAASLQESLNSAADVWAARGHPRPVLSFAGSSALARQIEAGAQADLFISADQEWMDELETKGLVAPGTRGNVLGNSLVLIAPAGSAVTLTPAPGFPLAAALGNGRLALADPSAVPAGRYAREALTRLAVWDSVSGRIVSAENVRAALALVARKEAALGVVYATDARAEPKVRLVGAFPESSHAPIIYPLARLKASANSGAEPFRAFLLSPEGQAVFARYGFTAPGN